MAARSTRTAGRSPAAGPRRSWPRCGAGSRSEPGCPGGPRLAATARPGLPSQLKEGISIMTRNETAPGRAALTGLPGSLRGFAGCGAGG